MVNPALQEPEGRHKGFAGSLLPHCASVVQAAHEFVAWLQIGAMPVHWESAVHWLVRSKLAVVGASGVEAAIAYCPEIELAVALTLAIPVAFVVAVMHPAAAGTQAEPPLSVAVAPVVGAWNVTTAPESAAPVPSRTSACSCEANAAPTVAVCGLPACPWLVCPRRLRCPADEEHGGGAGGDVLQTNSGGRGDAGDGRGHGEGADRAVGGR